MKNQNYIFERNIDLATFPLKESSL